MLNISPAVHENFEDKKHHLRLCTGILNGIKARVTALIECDQFPVNGGSQWQSFLESSADLRKLPGEVFPVSR